MRAAVLLALARAVGAVVHVVTTPTGEQSWTTLCSSGTENTCQLTYEEMGTSVDGVSQYDATNTTYNGIVRVGHTIRFLFDAGHDVIKMSDALCTTPGEFLSGSHDGEYDYVVTEADAAAGYIYFSCSTSNYGHCQRGQRVTVEVSDACVGEGCANVCSVAANEYTCWSCEDGYEIEDYDYRCQWYDCAGKCIESPPAPAPTPGPVAATDDDASSPEDEVGAAAAVRAGVAVALVAAALAASQVAL